MTSGQDVRDNLRWALGWGLVFATAFSVWVLVLSVLNLSTHWPGLGLSTWEIIGAYYLAAVLGGTMVGLLRPLTRWRLGSFVVGSVGGTIVYGAIGVAMGIAQKEPWPVTIILAGILGVLVGGGLAVVWHDSDRPAAAPHDQRRTILKLLGAGAVLAVLAYVYSIS